MTDFPDLPDFLRVTPEEAARRREYWKGVKTTKQGSGFKAPPTKQEEAATRELRREMKKAEALKEAARLAARKERRIWK